MSGAALPQVVRVLFDDLQHAGDGSAAKAMWQCGEAGREQLGTRVRFCVSMTASQVHQARFRAYGCPYTLAACEWLARRLQGARLTALSETGLTALVGAPADWAAALGVPPERLGRLLVIEDALRAALGGVGAPGVSGPDLTVTNPA